MTPEASSPPLSFVQTLFSVLSGWMLAWSLHSSVCTRQIDVGAIPARQSCTGRPITWPRRCWPRALWPSCAARRCWTCVSQTRAWPRRRGGRWRPARGASLRWRSCSGRRGWTGSAGWGSPCSRGRRGRRLSEGGACKRSRREASRGATCRRRPRAPQEGGSATGCWESVGVRRKSQNQNSWKPSGARTSESDLKAGEYSTFRSLTCPTCVSDRFFFLPPPGVGDVPSCGPRWAFSPAQADFQEPARVMDRSYSSPTPVEPRRNNALVLRPPPPPPSRNGWAPEGFDGWTLPKSALLNPIQRTFLWGCKQLKEPFPPRQS